MVDPLSDVISLLRPRAVFAKGISGAGRWAVRYSEFGEPSFCTVLSGRCRLVVDGEEPMVIESGDFVLLPATPGFVMSGLEPATPVDIDPRHSPSPQEEVRHGRQDGPADVHIFGGSFVMSSPDQSWLLTSMLPRMVHIRGDRRFSVLVRLVAEEAAERRPGCDFALARLVDLLLVEALRATQDGSTPPGLLRGLGDPRLAAAMRDLHGDPARNWTVEELAARAALSRSAFFERFTRAVGMAPMEYLLGWRMALARDLLRRQDASLAEIAERIGYGSASAFSTAFSRHVGMPPGRYAREAA